MPARRRILSQTAVPCALRDPFACLRSVRLSASRTLCECINRRYLHFNGFKMKLWLYYTTPLSPLSTPTQTLTGSTFPKGGLGARLSLHANRVEALLSRITFLSPQATYITPQRKRIRLDCENRHSARLGGTGSGTASRRGVEGARSPLIGPRGKAPSRERGYF